MWLVGYLFNNNGMGTWCWEAAHALADGGEDVTLLCSDSVVLPGKTTIPVMRVAAPALPAGLARFNAPGGMMARHGPRVVRTAVSALVAQQRPVSRILLNSTEFIDETVVVPQFAAAWATGITLASYLGRLRVHARGSPPHVLRATLSTLGWWRRDWFGFRHSTLTLAVTTPLANELRAHGVAAKTLYPCTAVVPNLSLVRPGADRVRFVTAAVSLDEPRKRVAWMLDALRGFSAHCELTLIGNASAALRERAKALDIPVRFTGPLAREDAVRLVGEHDVFLFASLLDDWGYVLTEAMAQGLAVVAPAASPFDEIIDDVKSLYEPNSPAGLCAALTDVMRDVPAARFRSWSRASVAFSRPAFRARLGAVTAEWIPRT